MHKNGQKCLKKPENQQNGAQKKPEFRFIPEDSHACFTAGPPVPTGEFPGGPATFVMRWSCGPVDFWDIHSVEIGKTVGYLKDMQITSLAGPYVLWVRKRKIKPWCSLVFQFFEPKTEL